MNTYFSTVSSYSDFQTSEDNYKRGKSNYSVNQMQAGEPPSSLKLCLESVLKYREGQLTYDPIFAEKVSKTQILEFCKRNQFPSSIFDNQKNKSDLEKSNVLLITRNFRNTFFNNLYLAYRRSIKDREIIDWFMNVGLPHTLQSIEVGGYKHPNFQVE